MSHNDGAIFTKFLRSVDISEEVFGGDQSDICLRSLKECCCCSQMVDRIGKICLPTFGYRTGIPKRFGVLENRNADAKRLNCDDGIFLAFRPVIPAFTAVVDQYSGLFQYCSVGGGTEPIVLGRYTLGFAAHF